MDRLFLRQLEINAVIGVYPHEKISPQPIFIDLEAAIDGASAAVTDDLAMTVDYSALYRYLCDYIPSTRFQLLETLAAAISKNLMEKFSLSWLRLSIAKKPSDMPQVSSAGIIIERGLLPDRAASVDVNDLSGHGLLLNQK